MKKIRVFLSEKIRFLEVKFSIYLNRRVFVMMYLANHFTLNYAAQLAFFINLQPSVIGPSAILTGRERPAIDLCKMLTGRSPLHDKKKEV